MEVLGPSMIPAVVPVVTAQYQAKLDQLRAGRAVLNGWQLRGALNRHAAHREVMSGEYGDAPLDRRNVATGTVPSMNWR